MIVGAIGVSLCLFLLMNCITKGDILDTVFFPTITDATRTSYNDDYMDFFNSMICATHENPYIEMHVIYPPLCYMLYSFFGHMIPAEYYKYSNVYIRSRPEGMFTFGCYMLISMISLAFFTIQYAKKKQVYSPWLIAALLLSAPMLFSIQRGNFIIFTVACLTAFLCYKDDESCLKRQFGFFMLAIAANIKMYPAIFGLLLVSEKRWRDCFFCLVYGVALFVLPMLCYGGLSNIPVLFGNIMRTTGNFSIRLGTRVDLGCLMSFLSAKGILSSLFSLLQGKTLLWGTGLLLLCYACMDTEWKRMLCLTIICTFIPGFSYMYNLLYLFPLLLVTIRQNSRTVCVLLLAALIYYPIDISFLPFVQVEGALLIPRLWDIIASLAGVLLIGDTAAIAAKRLALGAVSRKRIDFYTDGQKQIMFHAHTDA